MVSGLRREIQEAETAQRGRGSERCLQCLGGDLSASAWVSFRIPFHLAHSPLKLALNCFFEK
jgi:hypothetical protein